MPPRSETWSGGGPRAEQRDDGSGRAQEGPATPDDVPAAGLATRTTRHSRSGTGGRHLPPPLVVVQTFAVSPDELQLDHGPGAHCEELCEARQGSPRTRHELDAGHEVAGALAEKLVIAIGDMGLRTRRGASVPAATPLALLIRGQLVSIDRDSGTEALIIGLGAGRSDVRVWTQVYEVMAAGPRRIGQIEVCARSGLRPGAAETMGATAGRLLTRITVTAGLSVVSETMGASIVADSDRAAAGIARQLSRLFGEQGWA